MPSALVTHFTVHALCLTLLAMGTDVTQVAYCICGYANIHVYYINLISISPILSWTQVKHQPWLKEKTCFSYSYVSALHLNAALKL